ncbi:DNA polymerase delta subunit 3-like isoform X2 [Mya arenaria]|nr:DNA polymerase delta subunit 3-like isoform X2 [Mya arenaria]XP_052782701.1 DNA polymerase delta subunit 3-like isoform X2 [Mya arenaria]
MLYQFVQTERNEKGNDNITVTYFVSGLTKPDGEGVQAFKCAVVPEEKLTSYKDSYAAVTSCHVYSVQKSPLKDSNALYTTDYEKFKENVFESNKFSSIAYSKAEARSKEDMEMLTMSHVPETVSEKKAAPVSAKPAQKPMTKSAIQNMFAAKAEKKPAQEKGKAEKSPQKQEEPKAKQEQKGKGKAAAKKQGGMTAFFSKQADKKPETSVAAAKKTEKISPAKMNVSPAKSATKKTPRQEDSDDEAIFQRKRRRTDQDLFDSESEEEMEAEPESPVPPTPPREKTPEPKPDSPVIEVEEDPIPNNPPIEESNKGGKGKRRVKRRKHVNKTYMDKDGFMVTEKVWEEESTDASEAEEPVAKEAKKGPQTKSPAKGKRKASPKKPSPGKKNSGKQTSLTSFFKKS